MNNKGVINYPILFAVVFIIVVVGFFVAGQTQKPQQQLVRDFESCERAGYPIRLLNCQGCPKYCDTPWGQSFQSSSSQQLVGNDRDVHGCIGSAGYSWCEAKQKCLRLFEEKCEKETVQKDGTLMQGQVTISFSGNVTRDGATAFLKNLNLSVNENFLKSTMQFRELAYPSTRLDGLFAYLKSKSLVDDCRIMGEYPEEKAVNAQCNFRSTVSRDAAERAVSTYPGVGLSTEEPAPPIIYWHGQDNFFLAHMVISVPAGKEREWETKLRSYPEIASAFVVPLTQLPIIPR